MFTYTFKNRFVIELISTREKKKNDDDYLEYIISTRRHTLLLQICNLLYNNNNNLTLTYKKYINKHYLNNFYYRTMIESNKNYVII